MGRPRRRPPDRARRHRDRRGAAGGRAGPRRAAPQPDLGGDARPRQARSPAGGGQAAAEADRLAAVRPARTPHRHRHLGAAGRASRGLQLARRGPGRHGSPWLARHGRRIRPNSGQISLHFRSAQRCRSTGLRLPRFESVSCHRLSPAEIQWRNPLRRSPVLSAQRVGVPPTADPERLRQLDLVVLDD